VAVAPTSAALSGDTGGVVTYTLTVTNTGAAPDSFSITTGGTFAGTANPATLNNLAAGGAASVDIVVTIPSNATGGTNGVTVATITSLGDPTKSASATLTTSVNPVLGMTLSPLSAASGSSGVSIYNLTIANTGNVNDNYDIAFIQSGAFTVTLSVTPPIAVGAFTSAPVNLSVDATGATPGATTVVTLTVTSQTNAAITATGVYTTTAP
jgi:hypothetical protein